MKKLDLYISTEAPNVRDAAWLKPGGDGYVLKISDGGQWKDLKVSGSSTSEINAKSLEKLKAELIGSVQDKKSANTINGAKAYARDAIKKLDELENTKGKA